MDAEGLALGLMAAVGLAVASGLNSSIPLLALGLLSRAGLQDLEWPYSLAERPEILTALVVLAVLELALDKAPAFDSVLHVVQIPVIVSTAGFLAGSQGDQVNGISNEALIALGAGTGLGVHGLRSTFRPFVTVTTFGLGNSVISTLEDVSAAALALAAILVPPLALALIAAMPLGLIAAYRRLGRKARQRDQDRRRAGVVIPGSPGLEAKRSRKMPD